MATNKTLAPTNVTVQIPALADVPDMSVPANAIDKTIDAVNALNSQIVKLSNITEDIKAYGGGGTTIENTSYLLGELSISNKSGLLFYYASGTANLTANDVMVFRLYDGDTLLGGFGSTNLQGKQWISTSGHYKLTAANHTMRLVLTTFSGKTTINVPAYNSIVGRLMFIPLPA